MKTSTSETTRETIKFINAVKEADIWLLPDTPQNRKTTVWGKATAAAVKAGETREIPLCEAGEDGAYLLRMIDSEHFYYSANGMVLEPGYTLEVAGEDLHSMTATLKDESGKTLQTSEVFAARL